MKKQLLKIAVLAGVAIGFVGCGTTSTYTNGIYIPNDSIKKQNSSTKVYFEDQSLVTIKHNLQNIADYLNTNSIVPKTICKTSKVDAKEDKEFYKDTKCSANTSNEQINLKFKVDATNYVTTEKVYNNSAEAFNDFLSVGEFLYQELSKNPELREKLGTSTNIYYDAERLMKEKKLAFTIQREIVRDAISDRLRNQMNNAGWQMVNNQESADKVYLFDLTRDFTKDEVKEMRNKNTNMKINIFSNSSEVISMNAYKLTDDGHIFDNDIPLLSTQAAPKPVSKSSSNNFASNAVLGDSAMRMASTSNSNGSSAAVGVGVALGASVLESLFTSKSNTLVLPYLKEINNKPGNEKLQYFDYGVYIGTEKEVKGFLRSSNCIFTQKECKFYEIELN